MDVLSPLLQRPLFYNLWSSIFFRGVSRAITEVIQKKKNSSVLDLGCGTGRLKKYLPWAEFTGIDHNYNYIRYAKRHFKGEFLVGNFLQLDKQLGTKQFDYIILAGILHHIDHAQAAALMALLQKFLKPFGKVVIIDHVYTDELNALTKILLNFDRGAFIRDRQQYHAFFKHYTVLSYKKIDVHLGPVVLWKSLTRFVVQPV